MDDRIEQLRFLYDQVHQTAERIEQLPERLAMDIEPQSLNYEEDLQRLKGEYNRLVQESQAAGALSAEEILAAGLPLQFNWVIP